MKCTIYKDINNLTRLSILPGLLLLAFILTACERGIFFSDDEPAFRILKTMPFREISVNGIFEIELKNDTDFSVIIESASKVIENISCNVSGDTLIISDLNSFRWLPDYPRPKLLISFPDLETIRLNSPARMISSDTIILNHLSIITSGHLSEIDLILKTSYLNFATSWNDYGYHIFRGFTDYAQFRIYGSAQLDARELLVNSALVSNESIADAYVNVTGLLRVRLFHYGNVYYSGDPENIIIESMNSRGRLIPLN